MKLLVLVFLCTSQLCAWKTTVPDAARKPAAKSAPVLERVRGVGEETSGDDELNASLLGHMSLPKHLVTKQANDQRAVAKELEEMRLSRVSGGRLKQLEQVGQEDIVAVPRKQFEKLTPEQLLKERRAAQEPADLPPSGYEWYLEPSGLSWDIRPKTPKSEPKKVGDSPFFSQDQRVANRVGRMFGDVTGVGPYYKGYRDLFAQPGKMGEEAQKSGGGNFGALLTRAGSKAAGEKRINDTTSVLGKEQKNMVQEGLETLFDRYGNGRGNAKKWLRRNPNKLRGALRLLGGEQDVAARQAMVASLVKGFKIKKEDAEEYLNRVVPLVRENQPAP